MSQDLVLQVRDLNVWYRPSGTIGRRKRRQVLHDVSFDLHRGEILGLVGESGSGKTTLARTILGFVPDYTGTVTHFTKRPQMVFQDPASSLNPSRTVGWILAEPLRIYGKYGKEEIARRVERTMELVGLDWERFAEKSPFELSGGEKRRAALAGIIAMEPGYLILDEPMAGLDPAGRRAILDMLSGIRRETGCAVIMVSHSMDDIAAYSDRVAVMQDGSIIRTGTPAEIFGGELDLEAMGLDLPAASYLGNLLRSKGMDVPEIYTIDGMAEYLLGRRQGA